VVAYHYDGFFRPMDTIKDRQSLEALHESGKAPWVVSSLPAVGEPAHG
jgi:glucose-1-phosphate cytidylyltransferase